MSTEFSNNVPVYGKVWVALLAGFTIRLFWMLWINPEPVSDATFYLESARSLTEHFSFEKNGIPTAFYPPGYSFILAIMFFLAGDSLAVARFANILFQLISFWILFQMVNKLTGSRKVAIITLWLMVIYPNYIAYTNLIYNESFFSMLMLILVFVWLNTFYFSEKIQTRRWMFLSLFLALTVYVKPQAIFIPALMLLLFWKFNRNRVKKYLLSHLFVYLLALMLVAPWMVRNYFVMGKAVFTTVSGYDLLIGNNPFARGNYYLEESYWKQLPYRTDEITYNRVCKSKAIEFIINHPLKAISLWPRKIYYFFWPGMDGISWNMVGIDENKYHLIHKIRFLCNGYFVLLVIALVICFIYLFVHKKYTILQLLSGGLSLYFIFISLIFFGESRFHFPLIPFWMAVVSAGMTELIPFIRGSKSEYPLSGQGHGPVQSG